MSKPEQPKFLHAISLKYPLLEHAVTWIIVANNVFLWTDTNLHTAFIFVVQSTDIARETVTEKNETGSELESLMTNLLLGSNSDIRKFTLLVNALCTDPAR